MFDIVELALVLYKLSGFKHHKPDPNQSNTLSSNNVIPNNRTDALHRVKPVKTYYYPSMINIITDNQQSDYFWHIVVDVATFIR